MTARIAASYEDALWAMPLLIKILPILPEQEDNYAQQLYLDISQGRVMLALDEERKALLLMNYFEGAWWVQVLAGPQQMTQQNIAATWLDLLRALKAELRSRSQEETWVCWVPDRIRDRTIRRLVRRYVHDFLTPVDDGTIYVTKASRDELERFGLSGSARP